MRESQRQINRERKIKMKREFQIEKKKPQTDLHADRNMETEEVVISRSNCIKSKKLSISY